MMKNLLLFLLSGSLMFGQAANDLVWSQRKADNSGSIQRNVSPTANAALGVDANKLPVALTAFTQDSATGAVGITAGGANQNVTITPSGTGNIRLTKSGVGTPAAAWLGSSTPLVFGTNEGSTGGTGDIHLAFASDTAANRSSLLFRKAGGTLASPTAPVSGAALGTVIFSGYDGSAFQNNAAIIAFTDGSSSAGNVPTALGFETGTTARVRYITLSSAGVLSSASSTEATTGGAGSITTAGGIYATKAIISDSDTSSTTSQTGGIVQNGSSAATSVGIGGGNINAGGAITAGTPIAIASGGTSGATAAAATHALIPAASALTETAGATTIDCSLSNKFTLTLNANLTSVTLSNFADGQTIVVAITNTASNYTVTWGNSIKWPAATQPTQTVGATTDVWSLIKFGSTIYGSVVQDLR